MRRRYINFLLTYFHNSSKKAHVSSNWPAATPTGHFLSGPSSGPSARHVLVRPMLWVLSCNFNSRISHKLTNTHATVRLFTISHSVTACSSPNSVTSVLDRLTVGPNAQQQLRIDFCCPRPTLYKPAGVSCCCRSTKQKDGRTLDRFMTLVACYAYRVAIFCIC